MDHEHGSLLADPRFWVGVSFFIFFLIFGRKIWAPLVAALDKRSAAISNELREASQLRQDAEKMLVEAQARREAALHEAEAMLAAARQEAARIAEGALADAATSATRREQMAADRISAAEKAAVADVRLAAADIAARAAALVLAQGFSADADAALIDHAIQGLPAALSSRRAA